MTLQRRPSKSSPSSPSPRRKRGSTQKARHAGRWPWLKSRMTSRSICAWRNEKRSSSLGTVRAAGLLIGFASEEDWFDYRLEHHPEFLRRIAEARVRCVRVKASGSKTCRAGSLTFAWNRPSSSGNLHAQRGGVRGVSGLTGRLCQPRHGGTTAPPIKRSSSTSACCRPMARPIRRRHRAREGRPATRAGSTAPATARSGAGPAHRLLLRHDGGRTILDCRPCDPSVDPAGCYLRLYGWCDDRDSPGCSRRRTACTSSCAVPHGPRTGGRWRSSGAPAALSGC